MLPWHDDFNESYISWLRRFVGRRRIFMIGGLVVQPERLVGIYTSPQDDHYTHPNGDQIQGWAALFECRATGGSLRAQDGEVQDLAFVPRNDGLCSILAGVEKDLAPQAHFCYNTPQ